jgi:hypothetical protein
LTAAKVLFEVLPESLGVANSEMLNGKMRVWSVKQGSMAYFLTYAQISRFPPPKIARHGMLQPAT